MARAYQKKAQNNPVVKSHVLDSQDEQIGQAPDETIPSSGPARREKSIIAQASGYEIDPEKEAMLRFMEEPVTIRIMTSTDKNTEQCFEININGRLEFFRRGETKTVKRHFVDRIMRLKQTVYGQREVTNSQGDREFQYPASTALKYEFAIIRDDNPLGKSWERAVLAEPG